MIKEVPTEGYHLCELSKIEISTINQLVRAHNKAKLAAKDSQQLKQALALLHCWYEGNVSNNDDTIQADTKQLMQQVGVNKICCSGCKREVHAA